MAFAALRRLGFMRHTSAVATPTALRTGLGRFYVLSITDFSTTGEPMSSSYRCSTCGTNWPHAADYRVCPTCKLSCWIDYQTAPAMDDDDARLAANEAEFERYWEARELRLISEAAAQIANLPEAPGR